MSKKILAGVAVLGLAAVPVLGVSAATNINWTDTLTVSVAETCGIYTVSDGGTVSSDPMTNGTTNTINIAEAIQVSGFKTVSRSYTVPCNTNGGWKITAVGDGTESGHANDMVLVTDSTVVDTFEGNGGNDSISGGWGLKITEDSASITATGFTTYAGIPESATIVAESSVSTNQTTGKFSTDYQIRAKDTQTAGNYTGKVKYTLTAPRSSN